jgi:type II secretory pathway pseudopilin PulG
VKSGGAASVQRGFALIALLALAAFIAAFLIASALNFTSADNANEREDRSMSALRKAKAALIAYAANEQWQNTGGATPFQPGALPCPDRDNDGIAEDHEFPQMPCDTPLKRIGRFPWKTIGADDLRDASGESLWYAVSAGFLRNTPSYTNIINSETLGQLTVNGSAPASNVVAIVFAPGQAMQGQSRAPANLNDPASYLEQFDSATYATFTSTALPSAINNDRLLVITQADLMAAVEPIVAANIERDIGKGLLQDYFNNWGRYPFAKPFVSPPVSQGAYVGVSSPSPGTTMGLLPVTNTAVTWTATVTSLGTGTGIYDGDPTKTINPNPTTCSISSPPPPLTVTCTFSYGNNGGEDRPDIKIEAVAANASSAFADKPAVPSAANLQIFNANSPRSLATYIDSTYGYWSSRANAAGPLVPTMNFVLQASGAVLTYIGRLQNSHDMNQGAQITFQIPTIYLPRLTNPSGVPPNIAWFLSNQWYRQTYYAMALGYAPGFFAPGTPAACNPPTVTAPPCLTVNNLAGTTNDKQAILVFAGRALDGQIRPNGTLSNYFEGQNATPSDLIFEHRAGVPTAINDRVVVVSP